MNFNQEKDKEKKEENKDNKLYNVPQRYTIVGPNLGDRKTVEIYPSGYVKIIEGGV